MQFNKIVEKLKQGQSGVVDYKIKNNQNILAAASLEKAKENDICFLDNNSQLNLRNQIKSSKASALLLPADDKYIIDGSSYKGDANKDYIIGTWWNHSIVNAKAQISAVSGRIIEQKVEFLNKS